MERLTRRNISGTAYYPDFVSQIESIAGFNKCFPPLLDHLAAYEDAEENGTLIQLPKRIWRVIVNRKSNDWNDEPEYRIQEYTVFAYDADAKKYWCETPGWTGFKRRHWINAKTAFLSEPEAQKALSEGMK